LKDYQLEGVRWLASLFENGVSGILADGTFRNISFLYS
jgi:ATP-dependent DNA helicase